MVVTGSNGIPVAGDKAVDYVNLLLRKNGTVVIKNGIVIWQNGYRCLGERLSITN